MAVRLTETAIARAVREAPVTGRVDLSDAGQPGLRLRIAPPSRKSPTGTTSWALIVRDREGRLRRFVVGAYPGMGLAAAREAARALRTQVRQDGADPIRDARLARAAGQDAKRGVGTLGAVLDVYGGPIRPRDPSDTSPPPRIIGPGRDLRRWREARQKIELVFAAHLGRPLASLRAEDLQLSADTWGSPSSASAAVRYVRPVLKWAATRKLIAREVGLTLEPPSRPKVRDRTLTRDELRRVLLALEVGESPYRAAMRLMLWTCARREEAGAATWAEVDLDARRWRITSAKGGRPHVVHLSTAAAAFLTARRPASPPPEALIFPSRGGGRIANWDRASKLVLAESGTTGWSRHDLRRTAATLMGEAGVAPHIVELILGHAHGHSALASTYNLSRYGAEASAALDLLGNLLEGIRRGGAEVVALRAHAEK